MFKPAKTLALVAAIDPQDEQDKKYALAITCDIGFYEVVECSHCQQGFFDNQPTWGWMFNEALIRMHIACYQDWMMKQAVEFLAACEMTTVLNAEESGRRA